MTPGSQQVRRQGRSQIIVPIILFSCILLFSAFAVFPQSGTNTTGNGGRHTIQGRIFGDSGPRAMAPGIKVTLQSIGLGDLTVFVDSNGTFAFKNLVPGSYIVTLNAGDAFEPVSEPAYIDAPTGSSSLSGAPRMVGSSPQIVNLQIFLKPKRGAALRNEVLNAKWSSVPKEAVDHLKHGIELMDQGKDADAENEFRSALAIAPTFAPAHTGIGNIEEKQGKYENAAASFKEAIRYDANDFEANLGLGIADFNLRKFDEAEPALVNAAYLDRYSIMPHYYLGLIYSVRNDGDVAQKAFEKVRELDGGRSMPIIHKYLGRIYLHKQMNKQAVTEFEAYLSLLPNAKDAEAIRQEIAELKSRPNNAH